VASSTSRACFEGKREDGRPPFAQEVLEHAGVEQRLVELAPLVRAQLDSGG
jgi:hypothetical protein